jgi:hypothetical protein
MKKILFIAVVLPFLLSSCSFYKKAFHVAKTPFTSKERRLLESNDISLEKIQFYNDKKIVLKRELDSADTKVKSGLVQLENGKYINIVTLEKETPGTCTGVTDSSILVSFEDGDNSQMMFIHSTNEAAPYTLHTIDGKISYQNQQYDVHISSGPSITSSVQTKDKRMKPIETTSLLIKKNVTHSKKIKKRVMKGHKVK